MSDFDLGYRDPLWAQIEDKDEEIRRLKMLVRQAFITGWNEGAIGLTDRTSAWELWLRLNPDIEKQLQ